MKIYLLFNPERGILASKRGQFLSIRSRMESLTPGEIKVPAIVKAELLLGAHQSSHPKKVVSVVERFLEPYEITSFDNACAEVYCRIRLDLEKRGRPIGPNDLIIAATALAHRGTLVTHNTGEFGRIPALRIADWTRS